MKEARSELAVVASSLAAEFPETNADINATVNTFQEKSNAGEIRIVFLTMLGAVFFVLLIACANVANMLLSRAVARSREISLRTAIGASRWRIVRQLLIESIALSCLGGIARIGIVLVRGPCF